MLELNNLAPLVKKRKRVGRGGSRGGTSGKGNKGQNARSGGGTSIGYEGGQMPLYRRLPKHGFSNALFKQPVVAVNLELINNAFNQGEIVNRESLIERGVIKAQKSKKRALLKILATGELEKKLEIHADLFSKAAVDTIQKAGGTVHITKEN